MVRHTIRYGGKKRKSSTKKRVSRRRSSSRRRRSRRGQYRENQNSWGMNKGSSRGCIRVCLGSSLR
jgi:hypothetical protein